LSTGIQAGHGQILTENLSTTKSKALSAPIHPGVFVRAKYEYDHGPGGIEMYGENGNRSRETNNGQAKDVFWVNFDQFGGRGLAAGDAAILVPLLQKCSGLKAGHFNSLE